MLNRVKLNMFNLTNKKYDKCHLWLAVAIKKTFSKFGLYVEICF